MNQDKMVDKIGDNIGAVSAGVGLLLIEVVSALAMQPGFDRERFLKALEQFQGLSDDAEPTCRAVYGQLKEQLLATLKAASAPS